MVGSVPIHPLRSGRRLCRLASQHCPDWFRGSVVDTAELEHVRVSLGLLNTY